MHRKTLKKLVQQFINENVWTLVLCPPPLMNGGCYLQWMVVFFIQYQERWTFPWGLQKSPLCPGTSGVYANSALLKPVEQHTHHGFISGWVILYLAFLYKILQDAAGISIICSTSRKFWPVSCTYNLLQTVPHCPKIKADFRENKGGSPLEGKFSSNPWKWCLLS